MSLYRSISLTPGAAEQIFGVIPDQKFGSIIKAIREQTINTFLQNTDLYFIELPPKMASQDSNTVCGRNLHTTDHLGDLQILDSSTTPNDREPLERNQNSVITTNTGYDDHERYDIHEQTPLDRRRLLLALESDRSSNWSELDETPRMKFLRSATVTIKDDTEEWHGSSATIDTGSDSSFISRSAVTLFGLKTLPLLPAHILPFVSPIDHAETKPVCFVRLPLKCRQIGLEEVVAKLRVMETDGFEILLGRPFIEKHEVLAKLGRLDKNGNQLLAALRSTLSKGMLSLPNREYRAVLISLS